MNQSSLDKLNDIISNLVNSQVGQEAMNQFNEQMSELAKSFADSQSKLGANPEPESANPPESEPTESCQPGNNYLDCDCDEQEVMYGLIISHQLAILNDTPFCKLSRNDTQTLLELENLRKSIIDGAD